MTTYFIATTGNDTTGNGTFGNPWATISKAVSSSIVGDTIVCAAGTYTWASQTFTTDRFIIGSGASTCIFDAGASTTVSWASANAATSITGIKFQNLNLNGNLGVAPFKLAGATASLSFTSCIFTNITAAGGNWGFFSTDNGGNIVGTFTLIGCLFYHVTGGGNNAPVFSLENTISLAIALTNCTFYSNELVAITMPFVVSFGTTLTIALINNIIYNANGTPKGFGAVTSSSGTNNDIIGYSSAPALANQLSTDPLFVDAVNANFNLRPTSPCIDAGTPI